MKKNIFGEEQEQKVIGIGLSRTGTKSLNKALVELGYNAIHYPRQYKFVDGKIEISAKVLQNFNAYSDTPIALAFEDLDIQFPNSKFIYTTKEMESWLASCKKFFYEGHFTEGPVVELCQQLYGSTVFEESLFRTGYERHHQRVMDYFSDRKDDLLILDVSKEDVWEKLCTFLGKEQPKNKFPHLI